MRSIVSFPIGLATATRTANAIAKTVTLMLVLQQSARKTGVLASAIVSSGRSGPKDPPPQRWHQATASPLRRHEAGAMAVTPAGPASGRKAIVRHWAGHRDTS